MAKSHSHSLSAALVAGLLMALAQTCWAADAPVWTQLHPGLSPRDNHKMAYDSARDCVVLYVDGDTWEWKNGRWRIVTQRSPGARFGHRLASTPVVAVSSSLAAAISTVRQPTATPGSGTATRGE